MRNLCEKLKRIANLLDFDFVIIIYATRGYEEHDMRGKSAVIRIKTLTLKILTSFSKTLALLWS